ncbi:hypothetical protein FRACA_1450013 [Frankia canadensis]|uniref:Uncharacterized protein n=1 Tax=Frankia canadensis TaxID=1836972 RepID=A0A2I2KLM3_9ACTN|nr:hypothetical protein FRACA_1450013 [Frankia canadensis]SOU53853.1 hypothetical protein FRACA_1450013 [Frankia canadensis]
MVVAVAVTLPADRRGDRITDLLAVRPRLEPVERDVLAAQHGVLRPDDHQQRGGEGGAHPGLVELTLELRHVLRVDRLPPHTLRVRLTEGLQVQGTALFELRGALGLVLRVEELDIVLDDVPLDPLLAAELAAEITRPGPPDLDVAAVGPDLADHHLVTHPIGVVERVEMVEERELTLVIEFRFRSAGPGSGKRHRRTVRSSWWCACGRTGVDPHPPCGIVTAHRHPQAIRHDDRAIRRRDARTDTIGSFRRGDRQARNYEYARTGVSVNHPVYGVVDRNSVDLRRARPWFVEGTTCGPKPGEAERRCVLAARRDPGVRFIRHRRCARSLGEQPEFAYLAVFGPLKCDQGGGAVDVPGCDRAPRRRCSVTGSPSPVLAALGRHGW